MSMIAENYAQALYSLARDEEISEQVLTQIEILRDSFQQVPDYLRLLGSYNMDKNERCAIVDEAFRDKVHPYVLNFLKLLTQKGYARLFPDCVKAYRSAYNDDNGIVSVLAVTAVALTEEQTARLTEKLEQVTKKRVLLENKVDASCLGGVRLDYDGKRLDGTIINRLDAISGLLKNTVL
ncbi:MAG: ATP synthase F1 subunit delta [Oscillospiraceae bacterium]|nr:ATP synthase F1 subunit delta [Oscillospiraceae bacterium]